MKKNKYPPRVTLYSYTVHETDNGYQLKERSIQVDERPTTYKTGNGKWCITVSKNDVGRVVNGVCMLKEPDSLKAAYLLEEYISVKRQLEISDHERRLNRYSGSLDFLKAYQKNFTESESLKNE